ncbi:MAG: S1 RNA-binding domain-containing protein, partial [Thermomicrobiales bacterium]
MDGTDVSERVEATPHVEANAKVEETPQVDAETQAEAETPGDSDAPQAEVEIEAEAEVATAEVAQAVDATQVDAETQAQAEVGATAEEADEAPQAEAESEANAEVSATAEEAEEALQAEAETEAQTEVGATAEKAPLAAPEAEVLDGASLMEQFLSDPTHDYKSLKYGDVIDGTIMRIDRDELLVDIGSKSEGIVPSREFSSLNNEEKHALTIGENVLVFVVQAENPEGHPVVSIDRARQEKSWRRLQELYEANEVIEAEVTNYNKGGLLVNLDGVRG